MRCHLSRVPSGNCQQGTIGASGILADWDQIKPSPQVRNLLQPWISWLSLITSSSSKVRQQNKQPPETTCLAPGVRSAVPLFFSLSLSLSLSLMMLFRGIPAACCSATTRSSPGGRQVATNALSMSPTSGDPSTLLR